MKLVVVCASEQTDEIDEGNVHGPDQRIEAPGAHTRIASWLMSFICCWVFGADTLPGAVNLIRRGLRAEYLAS